MRFLFTDGCLIYCPPGANYTIPDLARKAAACFPILRARANAVFAAEDGDGTACALSATPPLPHRTTAFTQIMLADVGQGPMMKMQLKTATVAHAPFRACAPACRTAITTYNKNKCTHSDDVDDHREGSDDDYDNAVGNNDGSERALQPHLCH
jgi:hypothetical protein